MQPAKSIVFTHVPRTAGSSTHYAFLQASAPQCGHVFATGLLLAPNRTEIDAAFARDELYLGGHFSLQQVALHTGVDITRTVNFATVRDPLERFLSHHALIQTDERATAHGELRGTSIDAFVSALEKLRLLETIDNPHCVTICGMPRFEAARDALMKSYDFVAATGRVADLVELVTDRAGRPEWPRGRPRLPDFPHNSVDKRQRAAPSAGDLQRLEPYLAEDRKLLEWLEGEGGLVSTGRAG